MVNYGKSHRFLLRSVASRGVLTLAEAQTNLRDFCDRSHDLSIADMVREINEQIRPLQQKIETTSDEMTNEKVLVFISSGSDAATKAQGVFSAIELEYFRILLEQIMTTESRQVTVTNAVNLVSSLKPTMTKTDAEKILDLWCRMRYLDRDQNNYAMGIRTIHEFERYFRENMPDTIEVCYLCKHIVFRGYNCPACALAIHTLCLNKFLETVKKWPCCKYDFDQSQLERLNNESSRLSHNLTDASQTTVIVEQTADESIEQTQDIQMTQDIIPEISQRVSRKRKRQE